MLRLSSLLVCLLLAACGQKGPLYLPTDKPPITPGAEYRPPASPAEQGEEDAREQSSTAAAAAEPHLNPAP